jgi:ADP-ribose pyrophosphatase YjhB (NUDIX family)
VVHHRAVPHDLHVDLGALRSARVSARALLDTLRPDGLDPADLSALWAVPGGAGLAAEHDRLLAAADRAVREVTELHDALGVALAGLETAESHAVRSLTAADR